MAWSGSSRLLIEWSPRMRHSSSTVCVDSARGLGGLAGAQSRVRFRRLCSRQPQAATPACSQCAKNHSGRGYIDPPGGVLGWRGAWRVAAMARLGQLDSLQIYASNCTWSSLLERPFWSGWSPLWLRFGYRKKPLIHLYGKARSPRRLWKNRMVNTFREGRKEKSKRNT